MSILTVRPLKKAFQEFSTCTCAHGFDKCRTLKFNFAPIVFEIQSTVSYCRVVRSNLAVNSDWKRYVWTGIYLLHQDIVASHHFSIFKNCTFFNMTYGSSNQTRLTLKLKLDICAVIDSGIHYNVLITSYQVGKKTLTLMRKDSVNIRKCADAAGTTALNKKISCAT